MGIREYFASDLRFYYAIGVFIILVYCTVVITTASMGLATVDRRIIPLTAGFFIFMFVYFISISIQALEPDV